jgi:plastocyanin
MPKLTTLLLAATLSLGAVLVAAPAFAAQYTIVLNHLKFGPVPTGLKVGDTIVWQNDDIFRHSATARDKSFDIDLPPAATVTQTLSAAGSFDFFCKFHPGMTGTLVVSP